MKSFQLPRCVSLVLLRNVYICIFVLSGFSGLIYESVWTHYLKLFLGHAAYSQTLVLAIFMGGMALGAWLASRFRLRLLNPFFAYAITEAVIGFPSLLFHNIFLIATDFSYFTVIPSLGSAFTVEIYKWILAALLILPQSVLLGMTFPFMTAGLIRRFPERPGHAIAVLYCANSLGAVFGVLTSGFLLIGLVGLPGTIFAAGLVNVVISLSVYVLVRMDKTLHLSAAAPAQKSRTMSGRMIGILLVCAGVTGMTSFMYEIAWIRMLSLVLGSSTHAFELMLAAFIFGLAIGGFWIRTHVDRLQRPLFVLGSVQMAMGVLAVSTLMLYGFTFDAMQYALNALSKTDQGYLFFNIFSHSLAMFVMIPATICAGMTLPLLTQYLFAGGVGEKAIGHVYAVNTLGCIAGVVISIQFIMPLCGMKNLVIIGGALDIIIGLWLFGLGGFSLSLTRRLIYAGGSLCYLVAVIVGMKLDLSKMASGVYRTGHLLGKKDEIVYHRDGKTASIDLIKHQDSVSIRTNGKPDAGIQLNAQKTGADECTMTLLAALPMIIKPDTADVAVIGLGSGMSTHTVLNVSGIRRVDTIEIEPAMVEAAHRARLLVGEKINNTFEDPRSKIHIGDARIFFTNHQKKYDLIVSEPSNPWVSGIGGLFSCEFYRLVRRHVKTGGLFAQWLHLYEINVSLVSSVAKALGQSFFDYRIYGTSDGDILFLASQTALPDITCPVLPEGKIKKQLNLIGVRTPQDVALLKIGDRRGLDPLFNTYSIAPNSDFYPALDLGAVKARFLQQSASGLLRLGPEAGFFLNDVNLFAYGPIPSVFAGSHPLTIGKNAHNAIGIWQYFYWQSAKGAQPVLSLPDSTVTLIRGFRSIRDQCDPVSLQDEVWLPQLISFANATVPYLPVDALDVIWQDIETAPCYAKLPEGLRGWIALVRAWGERDYEKMGHLIEELLPRHGKIYSNRKNNFLLRLALIGLIKQKDFKAAKALWSRYQGSSNPNTMLSLRMLAALAVSGGYR